MGRAIILLASGTILAVLAGCSLCHHHQSCGGCPPAVYEAPLPNVERTSQEPVVQELAESVMPLLPAELSPPTPYRALPPQLCQCLAAKHAPLADGFDRQRQELEQKASSHCSHKSEKEREFQKAMLLYSALESRNQAAGGALEWYYQLAGAEAKTDLLNASLGYGQKTLQDIERLKKLEITLPAPLEEYQRQVAEVQLQQAQNQFSIAQLNTKLRIALGYETTHAWYFWPDPSAPLGAEVVPDVEEAVHLGLAQRPQLLLLRYMIEHLDRDTLKSSRSLLQTMNPLLGMSSPGPSCKVLSILGKILHIQPGKDAEVERVRATLCDDLHERERTVEAEIREAAFEVSARREAIFQARRAFDTWQKRLADLRKQESQRMPVFVELAKTYQGLYKARGDVIREFMDWKIAVVKLKQAQGILPAECGYTDCCHNQECPHESHE